MSEAPLKLADLGTRLQSAWKYDDTVATELIKPTSNGNRIYLYQQLIAARYVIVEYLDSRADHPTYVRYDEGDYHPVEDLHSPSYTYFVTPAADEKSNVFLLCTSADYFSLRYPPQALMTDLFDTLAVPEQALFGGLDGWALQRFDGSQLREGPS